MKKFNNPQYIYLLRFFKINNFKMIYNIMNKFYRLKSINNNKKIFNKF